MLIEFRVKNFRSLRDEQVLSMVASSDKTLKETHVFETGLKAAPGLLRSAAIYGANASGKSTLLRALQYMRSIVAESAAGVRPGETFSVQPFRLDHDSATQPTEFEVSFLRDGIRYQYGFAMTKERIVSEHLLVYRAFKPQRWFQRHYDAGQHRDVYEFGPGLKGQKQVWEEATRSNALFLSMAVQLNSESLRPVFDWFVNDLVIFNEHSRLSPEATIKALQDVAGKKRLCDFMQAADISLADIQISTRRVPGQSVHFDANTGAVDVRQEEMEEFDLRFHHLTTDGSTAEFSLDDESGGTRNLLFLSAPMLDMLEKGNVLLVDELDTSLHTLLVRELVRLFNHPATNTGNAQLIFTTHDTSLLDAAGLFRRDQIWLMDKAADQASSLVALSDYSPRKNEALERGYLIGRYGGIPFLDRSQGLVHHGT